MAHELLFPLTQPTLLIHDSQLRFPVRRIFCIAKNYAEHAREMGVDPDREAPFFFTKSPDDLVSGAWVQEIPYPPATKNLHHEVELVVALGENAKIAGYAVGIDFTRRDLQAEAKKRGRPWAAGKSFSGAAPVGQLTTANAFKKHPKGEIVLKVNGKVRQKGALDQMIWNIDEIIKHLSAYDRLKPGDLIFTGTPAGVGAVQPGDSLEAHIDGLDSLHVRITA